MEDKRMLQDQENLYWNSNLTDKTWYRKIFGGTWWFIKIGKDTPNIGMFSAWTKIPQESWSGYTRILDTKIYPETGVNTRFKFYKEFFKNIYKRYFRWNKKKQ